MSKDKEIESVLFDEKGMFELIENEKRNTDKISLINEIIKRRAKRRNTLIQRNIMKALP